MKACTKELIKIIEGLEGKLIGIGLEEKELLNAIEQNDHIIECSLLESVSLEEGKKKRRGKYVVVRKIRKKFKKKNHDVMLIHYPYIAPYLKSVIKDSIYITKKEIYIYGLDLENLELLKKRYQRYRVTLETRKIGKQFLLVIHTEKAKTCFFSDLFYYIGDSFYNLFELLSEFLVG